MRWMIHKVPQLLWIGLKVVEFIQTVGFEVVDIFPIVRPVRCSRWTHYGIDAARHLVALQIV